MPETPPDTTAVTSSKLWLQAIKILGPAVVAWVGSVTLSGSASDDVKDKAEAGYQFARRDIEEIKDSLKALQDNDIRMADEIADIRRRAKLSAARQRAETAKAAAHPAPAAVSVTVNAPSAPLPANLDQALEAQKAAK